MQDVHQILVFCVNGTCVLLGKIIQSVLPSDCDAIYNYNIDCGS